MNRRNTLRFHAQASHKFQRSYLSTNSLIKRHLRHFIISCLAFGTGLAFTSCDMKLNIIPTNKFALLSAALFAVTLAFSQNASALPTPMPPSTALAFNDTHVVGTITPGAPADPADVATYINNMIALPAGGSDTFAGQTITRSTNLFGSLPTASATGAVTGTGTTIDLNTLGTFTYLFAKYDGQNDISQVWNIAGLTGVLTIPAFGPLGYGLSGWILFGPTGTVPDGGTTVMLLGAALGALGMARRFLKR
jgi:hypothetical protein